MANIRETDAIIHVLRCFDNDNIVHVDGSVDPIRDKETIDIELQLKDLETVEKNFEKVGRSARTGNKEALKEQEVLEVVKSALESAKNVRSLELKEEVRLKFIKPLQLITDKPVLYVCNVDEGSAKTGNNIEQVKNDPTEESAGLLLLAVSTEADINELESFEERQMFLDDLGLEEAGSKVN